MVMNGMREQIEKLINGGVNGANNKKVEPKKGGGMFSFFGGGAK